MASSFVRNMPSTRPPALRTTPPDLSGEGPEGLQASREARPRIPSSISDPHGMSLWASPLRQHKRTRSVHREIKETLDAHAEFMSDESDGRSYHRINQYTIMDEIGRGSFGAVHSAIDQFGKQFAVKEFSKARLRRRAQSHLLRQGPQGFPRHVLPRASRDNKPLYPPMKKPRMSEENDALYLIREEIAIMKKLNHPNLVQLIEVLDDPEEDSLYMVLDMCQKGVVMKVGLEEDAEPYSDETCRCWFRDLILGIEYLHSQGVIHRDIKPDNLLLSKDEVLKVVDFGVSEMFEKSAVMKTARSAGSPAFLPPELCGKHKEVLGKAADIWSMGVSLYCLKYGKIPFNRPGVLEMYDAIRMEKPHIPADEDPAFVDLMERILEKDAEKRITMDELREHAWVTRSGSDLLLSAEENCAHRVEPPNELELNRAFTPKVNHLICVVKAIQRFKALLGDIRARKSSTTTEAPDDPSTGKRGEYLSAGEREEHRARAAEIQALIDQRRRLLSQEDEEAGKGSAQAGEDTEPPFLGIGTSSRDAFALDKATPDVVSHSPTAVDFNVYDRAYEEAVQQQLKANKSGTPKMYLTRFVKETEQFKKLENLVEGTVLSPPVLKADLRESKQQLQQQLRTASSGKLGRLVSKLGISDAPGVDKSSSYGG